MVQDLNEEEVTKKLQHLKTEKHFDSIAVVLMHSYGYVDHELKIGLIAKQIGFS